MQSRLEFILKNPPDSKLIHPVGFLPKHTQARDFGDVQRPRRLLSLIAPFVGFPEHPCDQNRGLPPPPNQNIAILMFRNKSAYEDFFGEFCLDVRAFTFCQLMSFPNLTTKS